jgi:hypothetical protein
MGLISWAWTNLAPPGAINPRPDRNAKESARRRCETYFPSGFKIFTSSSRLASAAEFKKMPGRFVCRKGHVDT